MLHLCMAKKRRRTRDLVPLVTLICLLLLSIAFSVGISAEDTACTDITFRVVFVLIEAFPTHHPTCVVWSGLQQLIISRFHFAFSQTEIALYAQRPRDAAGASQILRIQALGIVSWMTQARMLYVPLCIPPIGCLKQHIVAT